MEIASDKVGEVIHLAREVAQDRGGAGAGAGAQLDGLIEAMAEDEAHDLVALLWVGRGDFEPEEWAEARRTAREEATAPLGRYLADQPQLADHLEAGLEAMGVSARDAEDDATAP